MSEMEEDEIPNFNSMKHKSIELATNTDLSIKISKLTFWPKIITFGGIIVIILSIFLILIKRHKLDYISLSFGGILFITGTTFFIKLKYKLIFSFKGEKLILIYGGLICLNTKEYLISKLDYIIIDQIHVENDGEKRFSDDEKQEEIPCKIIINSIEEGYEEVFSGSGNPPLFTNDEVQFFNQFMKVNINRIKN